MNIENILIVFIIVLIFFFSMDSLINWYYDNLIKLTMQNIKNNIIHHDNLLSNSINIKTDDYTKDDKFINIQKIKGLIKGWQSLSDSLKNKKDYNSANIVDRCIDELTALLSLFTKTKP